MVRDFKSKVRVGDIDLVVIRIVFEDMDVVRLCRESV